MDRAAFFKALKVGTLYNSLRQSTVTTLDAILDQADKIMLLPVDHVAYMMATAYHEVGPDLKPVRENMNYTTVAGLRNTWPSRFKTNASAQPYVRQPAKLANLVYAGRYGNGDTASGDGWRYRGGGLPQTTFKDNYRKIGDITGVDLVTNPERILEPSIAVAALVQGMINGVYTGKKLSHYAFGDYYGMREIINNDMKKNGNAIAQYARAFEKALRAANYGQVSNSCVA